MEEWTLEGCRGGRPWILQGRGPPQGAAGKARLASALGSCIHPARQQRWALRGSPDGFLGRRIGVEPRRLVQAEKARDPSRPVRLRWSLRGGATHTQKLGVLPVLPSRLNHTHSLPKFLSQISTTHTGLASQPRGASSSVTKPQRSPPGPVVPRGPRSLASARRTPPLPSTVLGGHSSPRSSHFLLPGAQICPPLPRDSRGGQERVRAGGAGRSPLAACAARSVLAAAERRVQWPSPEAAPDQTALSSP